MIRELDAECARAMGLEIVHDDWPCGVPPDGCNSEAALRDDDDNGSWFNERGPVYKEYEPLDEWRSELGLWCAPIPAYSNDHAAARQLEDEIERRGLQERYIEALDADIRRLPSPIPNVWQTFLWLFIRATPEQKCRAFLEAIT